MLTDSILRQFKSIWMSIIVNSRISFVFALMKCSYAAFGEQNKIDNDRKCQLVYKKICSIRFIRRLE